LSFTEKSAWVSFVSILVFFGIYFIRVAGVVFGGASPRGLPALFFTLVAGLVVLEVVVHTVLAIRSPREAQAARDERERLISMRATQVAFPVLLVGAFAAVGTLHLSAGSWEMAHATLLAIVVAELVRFGAQIVYFRRDA
jgi:fatty acid desaturase